MVEGLGPVHALVHPGNRQHQQPQADQGNRQPARVTEPVQLAGRLEHRTDDFTIGRIALRIRKLDGPGTALGQLLHAADGQEIAQGRIDHQTDHQHDGQDSVVRKHAPQKQEPFAAARLTGMGFRQGRFVRNVAVTCAQVTGLPSVWMGSKPCEPPAEQAVRIRQGSSFAKPPLGPSSRSPV